MTQHPEPPHPKAVPKGRPARGAKGRLVRTLARGTLLAAGLAMSQVSLPEIDPRFRMFDPTLLDRLQAPITRHHE